MCKAGTHSGWDSSPLRGTMLTHIHTLIRTYEQFGVVNQRTVKCLGSRRKPENLQENHTYTLLDYISFVFSLMPNWNLPCYPKANNKKNVTPMKAN